VEFRVLGPLEVIDGDRKLSLGGPRQRLVLAYLLLDANRVVPTDRLIDRIWGDEPPDAARSALFAYISRLKKLLGSSRIQARPPGYVLVATAAEVDSLRFAELVGEARQQTDRATMAALLGRALGLWHGDPLSDLAGYDALRPQITRLDDLRLSAEESHAEALLAIGQHAQAVPRLEALVSEHPLRERSWALLMLGLYRSGRQGDALAAFHRARNVLGEELGIDPSAELRRLQEQVLQQDPGLDLSTDKETPTAAAGPALSIPATGRRATGLLAVGAAVTLAVALVAAWWFGRPGPGLPAGPWRIALVMPLSGSFENGEELYGRSIRNAVQLAIDDVNAVPGVTGATLELAAFDRAVGESGFVADATQIVADDRTIAMIGPLGSAATFPVLPLTNRAGLLECSPEATHPALTKPRNGALDLRAARPQAVNFIRMAPADDIQSVALSAFAYTDLNARTALIVDLSADWRVIADAFESEYSKAGGTSIRRTLNPGAAPASVLEAIADPAAPGVVFLAGDIDSGVAIRSAMADLNALSTPLLSWDGLIFDTSMFPGGEGAGSYILRVGARAAEHSFAAHASLPDQKFSFADGYRARYGEEPNEYAAAGYACVEIVAVALRGIASQAPNPGRMRELVRAYAVDQQHRYETVLGTVGFDANGDSMRQFVTFYRVDPSAGGGVGDWVLLKKQDFGPAP
jgi:DNA-binding SARP family transcriptional activator/ABC-type branched-subunit amino acid transport system substrate-binding protein